MSRWLLRRFDNIGLETRRLWSARLLIASSVGYIVNQLGWFAGLVSEHRTDQITNVLSWFALVWTALTALMAADIREREEGTMGAGD